MATFCDMRLSAYLEKHKISAAAFGREIGVTRSTVIRWTTGVRSPNSAAMQAIINATKGQVSADDFFKQANAA